MIAGIVLTAAGALLIVVALGFASLTLLRRRSWKQTDAEIVESSIETLVDSKNRRLFRGVFLLRYRALNDIREALVRSSTTAPERQLISALVEARPPGSRVRIHYDPHAPSQVTTSFASVAIAFGRAAAAALTGIGLAAIGGALQYLAQPPEW